jgi:hypothetical protein
MRDRRSQWPYHADETAAGRRLTQCNVGGSKPDWSGAPAGAVC